MNIGFDGKRAINNMTGLGNYSRLIIESIGRTYPADSLFIYTPSLKENNRLKAIKALPNTRFITPTGNSPLSRGALWRSFGITRALGNDNIDIFHGLSNELPLNITSAGIPSVVTIHDVIYRTMPSCYSLPDRLIYDFKYGEAARNATRIIAVSQRTKEDIIRFYNVPPDKIDVVYQGCDDSFRQILTPPRLEDVRQRYSLPKRYLLQVGTIERRKNLELAVKALPSLPAEIILVAVGRPTPYLEKVRKLARRLGVDSRLITIHNLPFADLPAVCQRAEIILYPSRYEGFGIPVIEGLESSRPVIAATGSCLEEAGGKAAWYVHPDDATSLASLITDMITGNIDTTPRIAAGKRYARRFDNANMARCVMEVYKKAITGFSS